MTNQPDVLYRCYASEGDLLYIGITANLRGRIKEHLTTSRRWWPLVARIETTAVSPEVIRQVEADAIRLECPGFNVAHNRGRHHQRSREIVQRSHPGGVGAPTPKEGE